jgi:hypothetical protein
LFVTLFSVFGRERIYRSTHIHIHPCSGMILRTNVDLPLNFVYPSLHVM